MLPSGLLACRRVRVLITVSSLALGGSDDSTVQTLSLGLDNRRGMYNCATHHTHLHTDAVGEIGLARPAAERRGRRGCTVGTFARRQSVGPLCGRATGRHAQRRDLRDSYAEEIADEVQTLLDDE